MKVVHLTDRYYPAIGGVETHVRNLNNHLKSLGVNTTIVSTNIFSVTPLIYMKKSSFPPDTKIEFGIRLLPLPQSLGVVAPGMINDLHGDVVHAHGLGRFPTFLWWASHAKKKRFIVTTHSDEGTRKFAKKVFDSLIPAFTILHADAVIALSEHEKEYLIRLGVNENKISVIPNGVDLKEVELYRNKSMHQQNSLLFAGRMDIYHKGLDILLQAIQKLVNCGFKEIKLHLAGPEVGFYSTIQKLVDNLGIRQNVIMHGLLSRKSLLRLMANSTALVLPSRFEPFGIVILEAMALGTPVVATSVGGIPEILKYGKCGIIVRPNDPDALADGIERLLSDGRKANSVVKAALDEVRNYSWDKIAIKTLTVYKQLLS